MKKLLYIVLIIIFSFNTCSAFGICAVAGDYSPRIEQKRTEKSPFFYYITPNNTVIIGGTKSKSKKLVIPNEINGYPVKEISYSAFYNNGYLESVTIPDSVEIINRFAFKDCKNLKSVKLGKKIKYIGKMAFKGTAIYNRNCEKGLHYIGKYLLGAELDIKKANVREGTRLIACNALKKRKKLTSVKLPKSLKYINNAAFLGCKSLKKIIIPDGVKVIPEECFLNCRALKRVTLPSKLKRIEVAAFRQTGIEKLALPRDLKAVGYLAFCDCTYLSDITFGNKLTCIEWASFHNTAVKDLVIPEGIKFISEDSFAECKKLQSLSIPDSVESICSCAFSGCTALEEVSGGNGLTHLDFDAFKKTPFAETRYENGVFYFAGFLADFKEDVKEINVKQGIEKCADFNDYTKYAVEKISFPSGFDTDTINFDMFNCSRNLREINIDENAKGSCRSVNGIVFSADMKALVKYPRGIDGETYSVPESVTTIEEEAFYGSKIKSIELKEGLKTIGDRAFFNCTNLKNVSVPDSVEVIGRFAFGIYVSEEEGAGYYETLLKDFTISGRLNSAVEFYVKSCSDDDDHYFRMKFKPTDYKAPLFSVKSGKNSLKITPKEDGKSIKYKVKYRLNNGEWKTTVIKSDSLSLIGLKKGKYEIKLRGIFSCGKWVYSDWSEIKTVNI